MDLREQIIERDRRVQEDAERTADLYAKQGRQREEREAKEAREALERQVAERNRRTG